MIENPVRIIKEFVDYQPTQEEQGWGMLSSIKSPGITGWVNKKMALICMQEDADFKGFIDHWINPDIVTD